MAHCFVTRSLPGSALDRLAAEHDVEVWPGRLMPKRTEIAKRAAGAEGLLCMLTDRIDAELLDACPHLRAISNYAVGWDNVDVAAAGERGIPVGHTPGVLTETTADFAFGLMLAVSRRLVEADAHVRAGRWIAWEPGLLLGRDIHGATLGILGYGRIGRAVARRAEAFGMTVLKTRETPLEELLERSDFVTIHVPLGPETRGMIGEAELRRMRSHAVLVNTSRGPIVDSRALERALREGWIGGAGLDVTDPEPLPAAHPLLEAPNLVVAPHIASASHEAREAMAEMAVDNLLAGLAGEPMPHAVDPGVGGQARRSG